MIRPSRRQLLQGAGALGVAAALGLPRTARAQSIPADATYFIEICLRDQFDFGHVMVAPGLATYTNLIRGENGRKCALFYGQNELTAAPNNVYLTPQSQVLQPHVDSIAMLELCELTQGPVHGHEAANPVRSPGRTLNPGSGRIAMWQGEPGANNSEGAFYSSTPTHTALHNYCQKQLTPTLRNAVAIKGQNRPFSMYHFGAGLPGSEPDRVQTVDSLLQAFPSSTQNLNILPTEAEANFVTKFLKRADARHLTERRMSSAVKNDHDAQLVDARGQLYVGAPKVFNLPLTAEERAYWSQNQPAMYGRTTINLWEQAAYAFKLISNDITRSVALEIDIGDVHGERTAVQMRDQNALVIQTLARLIESLKQVGLYSRTLIAVYTNDGGRSPAASSSGDEGKNGAILAGGMIRGGYYGDIRVDGLDGDGHRYRYHMPDLTLGTPISTGTTGNTMRLPGASLWRTVAKALKVPDVIAGGFPDVASASPLSWLLK